MKAIPLLMAALIAGGAAFALGLVFNQRRPQNDIVNGAGDNRSLPVAFDNVTNLTNNGQDLVYGQSRRGTAAILWYGRIPSALGTMIFS